LGTAVSRELTADDDIQLEEKRRKKKPEPSFLWSWECGNNDLIKIVV